jgi:hypothetical protein
MDGDGRASALEEAGIALDPVIEAYKKDVDRTLLRERRGAASTSAFGT